MKILLLPPSRARLARRGKRLADAERTLQTKATKAATESRRIATDKISWSMGKLADLNRTELKDRDARIFPGNYAPARHQTNAVSVSPRREVGVL